jgi:hypothetical protein
MLQPIMVPADYQEFANPVTGVESSELRKDSEI